MATSREVVVDGPDGYEFELELAQLQEMMPHLNEALLVQTLHEQPRGDPERVERAMHRLLALGTDNMAFSSSAGPSSGFDTEHAFPRILLDESGSEDVSVEPQDPLEAAVQALQVLKPDCHPEHFKKLLKKHGNDQNAVMDILFSDPNYPKRPSTPSSNGSGSSSSTSSSSRIKSVVAVMGKGAEYWFDEQERAKESTRSRGRNYSESATKILLDEFVELSKPGLCKLFKQSGYAYAVAWKRCRAAVQDLVEGRQVPSPLQKLKCPRKPCLDLDFMNIKSVWPLFLREERQFVLWWQQQGEKEQALKEKREEYVKQCQANGMLLECECCADEKLAEETIQCPEGHLFCSMCTEQYVKVQVSGEGGMPRLTCLSTDGCPCFLPRSELERVLSAELLASYDARVQKATIEAAMLQEDSSLAKCGFCDFAMDMPPPEENKIFVCQNPKCLKETCRLCGEENHIPLRCDQVEKKAETCHRLAVEEAMTEALVRKCPECKRKGLYTALIKQDGCNKMDCPKCKSWFCYLCSEKVPRSVGYGHFCQHPLDPGHGCSKCTKCPLWDKKALAELEAQRVAQAGLKAHAAYKADHGDEAGDEPEVLKGSLPSGSNKRPLPAPARQGARQKRGRR